MVPCYKKKGNILIFSIFIIIFIIGVVLTIIGNYENNKPLLIIGISTIIFDMIFNLSILFYNNYRNRIENKYELII
jgi:MFS-type transporter involved in bile tolerance (Atg22 family)